jgi:hypothetical protein
VSCGSTTGSGFWVVPKASSTAAWVTSSTPGEETSLASRLGDVTVLSDDYFSVADSDLRKLHSQLTVLGGTIVHSGAIRYWA